MSQTALSLDPTASPTELADAIVGFPDGTDLCKGLSEPLFKTLLVGKKEERNPPGYAEIFRTAAAHPKASPWMRLACQTQEVNGLRRAKGGDLADCAARLDAICVETKQLPESAARHFLLGDIAYNQGIVNRNLRRYKEAAAAQRQSALAHGFSGRPSDSLTSLFVSLVEDTSQAFVDDDAGLVSDAIDRMVWFRDLMTGTLPQESPWMAQNASVHIAWAAMMADLTGVEIDLDPFEDDFNRARATTMPQWKEVFACWDLYRHSVFGDLEQKVGVDLPSSSADNATLTVKILVALAKREQGDAEGARTMLEAVANHAGADGGIPIAVARQLLV